MDLAGTTKELLQTLRDNSFDYVLSCVKTTCENFDIDKLDMSAHYIDIVIL